MKKLLFLILFTLLFVQAATKSGVVTDSKIDLKRYDEIFDQIGKKRDGPTDEILSKVVSPFIDKTVLKIIKDANATRPKPVVLKLYGIAFNRANINKKWYKVNSKVFGYKLVKIKDSSVVLRQKKGKRLELFLRKKNDKIQINKNL